jgi:hypothetical protein
MIETRKQVTAMLAAAAVILAAIVLVSPHTAIVGNEVSKEVYGIDVLAVTRNATNLAEQQFPAY